MYRIYKGQPFTISSTEIRPGQWELQILITGEKNMRFSIESQRFKTLREAEQYGAVWVKQWIDEGKPAIEPQTEKSDVSLASVLRAVKEGDFYSRCLALSKYLLGLSMMLGSKEFARSRSRSLKLTMQKQDEYEELGRQMDQLAAEYSRSHDRKITAEILEIVTRRVKMVEMGEAVETELLQKKILH